MIVPGGDVQGKGGRFCPTQGFVDAFLMEDGTEFNTTSTFGPQMYEKRESRFYATILYNEATLKGRNVETWVGANPTLGNGRDKFFAYNTNL